MARLCYFIAFLFILSLGELSSLQVALAAKSFKSKPQWKFVEKKLKSNGFRPEFIKAFKKVYSPDDFEEVISLNTLLFLRKADYHGPQVDARAQSEVQEFIENHKSTFRKVETEYGVDRHVIAGLLWMESRLGRNEGQFHVPSIFGHMIQAGRPDVRIDLWQAAKEYGPIRKKERDEIVRRSEKKVKWALKELKALAQIYAKDKTVLKDLSGSFSGAFGLPQFLPSSYLTYAKSFQKKKKADLFIAEDAISSVAFYLKVSGWRAKDAKSHETALFKYNNSHDYTSAILDLSKRARHPAAAGN